MYWFESCRIEKYVELCGSKLARGRVNESRRRSSLFEQGIGRLRRLGNKKKGLQVRQLSLRPFSASQSPRLGLGWSSTSRPREVTQESTIRRAIERRYSARLTRPKFYPR